MKRRRMVALGLSLAALASGGCTVQRLYSGVPLRGDHTQIVAGSSKRAEVLKVLGPPTAIEHQTQGDAFVYRYRQVNYSSLNLQEPIYGNTIFFYSRTFDNNDTLVVLFDFHGTVTAVGFRNDTRDMPIL